MIELKIYLRTLKLSVAFALLFLLSGSVGHGWGVPGQVQANCSFSPPDGEIIGYRISLNEIYEACTSIGAAKPLPNQLIVAPGTYLLNFQKDNGETLSRVVVAKRPGIYKFIAPGFGSRQFQVWWPKLGVSRLFKDFGYFYVHGNKDDHLDVETLAAIGTTRNISVTCGTISNLIRSELKKFRIDSRIAISSTIEQRNGLDDGHIMLEVRADKSWVLFDPDSRSFFGTRNRRFGVADISASFVPTIGKNIQVYGPLMMVDVGGFVDLKGNDLSFLEQRSRISSNSLGNWYKRVLGVVGVEINGTYYFNKNLDNKRMQMLRDQYRSIKFVSTSFFRR